MAYWLFCPSSRSAYARQVSRFAAWRSQRCTSLPSEECVYSPLLVSHHTFESVPGWYLQGMTKESSEVRALVTLATHRRGAHLLLLSKTALQGIVYYSSCTNVRLSSILWVLAGPQNRCCRCTHPAVLLVDACNSSGSSGVFILLLCITATLLLSATDCKPLHFAERYSNESLQWTGFPLQNSAVNLLGHLQVYF